MDEARPSGWAGRAAALLRLEVDRAVESDPEVLAIEAVNRAVAARLRRRITAGSVRDLRGACAGLLARGGDEALDLLLAHLLDAGPLDPEILRPEPDLVAYQPTPGRVVLDLVDLLALGPADTLVDLGSGLGHVAIPAALWSGAGTIGVEREPAFVTYARRSAAALGLDRVQFLEGDAREVLPSGTAWFLYTPFRGAVLQGVVARIRALGSGPMVAYGPCVGEIERMEGWRAVARRGELVRFEGTLGE